MAGTPTLQPTEWARSPKKVPLSSPPTSPLADWAKLFKMLSDPSRLEIVLALARQGEMNVSTLTEVVGQSQPAVSHHLSLLKKVDLVVCRKEGKNCFYSLTLDNVRTLLDGLCSKTRKGTHHLELEEVEFRAEWK